MCGDWIINKKCSGSWRVARVQCTGGTGGVKVDQHPSISIHRSSRGILIQLEYIHTEPQLGVRIELQIVFQLVLSEPYVTLGRSCVEFAIRCK